MDIGRTISFVQEDEKWLTKIGIGGLLTLVPIVGSLATLGYMAQTARNVALGEAKPLPTWDNFGALLMRGLHAIVISLVYMLPYIIIAVLFSCVSGGVSAGLSESGSDSVDSTVGLLSCIIAPLMLVVALAGAVLNYGGLARYVATDRLSAAFEFGEVMSLLRNHMNLWLMALVVGLLSALVAMVGLIGCGIGVIFTGFFAYCMQGHALGQIIREIGLLGPTQQEYVPPAAPPTIQL